MFYFKQLSQSFIVHKIFKNKLMCQSKTNAHCLFSLLLSGQLCSYRVVSDPQGCHLQWSNWVFGSIINQNNFISGVNNEVISCYCYWFDKLSVVFSQYLQVGVVEPIVHTFVTLKLIHVSGQIEYEVIVPYD